jgi:succinate dehydrogenase / fumarate reductase iron-sulfur subunit
MKVRLKIWRQKNAQDKGGFQRYELDGVSDDMSVLEMLDVLNETLIKKGEDPVEFDSDCREGICGSCGCVINGQAHGPRRAATTCQIYMRSFKEGDELVLEPWRAKAFPVIKDLVVDRSAFDRIQQAGGYTSAKTSRHIDANAILIPKPIADAAMSSAACIGCGACVAACPNASASLFTAARISQFAVLPQGAPLREDRVLNMVERMDKEGFGNCTNIGECQAVCPAEISISNIAQMKREYARAAAQPPRQEVNDNA